MNGRNRNTATPPEAVEGAIAEARGPWQIRDALQAFGESFARHLYNRARAFERQRQSGQAAVLRDVARELEEAVR